MHMDSERGSHARNSSASARERAEIRHIRRSLEAALDRIIAVLDQLSGDPDLEADGSDELSLQPTLRGGVDALAA